MLVYYLAEFGVARSSGAGGAPAIQLNVGRMSLLLAMTGSVLLVLYLLHTMLVLRPSRLFRHIGRDLYLHAHPAERLWAGLPLVLLVSVFASLYSSWKVMIPELIPYAWDPLFERWDRLLHGGTAPWEWLHPAFGHPWLTSAINFLYNLWLPLTLFVLHWQAFSIGDRVLRLQFFLAFFIAWGLLGSVAATLMSSAGPCYFGRVTGLPDPFVPLMDYLHETSTLYRVWSLDVQEKLWQGYLSGHTGTGGGISAMPSMHVSSTVLLTLLAWRIHPALGWLLSGFLVAILIGSVHLGWHYAIDGYASIILTIPIWLISGKLARRFHRARRMR